MNINTIKKVFRHANVDVKSVERESGDHLICSMITVKTVKTYEQLNEKERQLIIEGMQKENITHDGDLCFIDPDDLLTVV